MCNQTAHVFITIALSAYVAATLVCIPIIVSLRDKLRNYPMPQKREELEDPLGIDVDALLQSDDYVAVPRSLLGAACYAIREKSHAPKILQSLKFYSMQPKISTGGEK